MTEPANPPKATQALLVELGQDARPADVSDSARRKLFEEWEKAGVTIQRAEQMRQDAIKHQAQCAEAIVKKLGPGHYRYKDKLFVAQVSKKGVVFLREAAPRKKDG